MPGRVLHAGGYGTRACLPGYTPAPGMLPGAPSVPHVRGSCRIGPLPRPFRKAIGTVVGPSTARGSEQIWTHTRPRLDARGRTSRQPTKGTPLVGSEVVRPEVSPQGCHRQSGSSGTPPSGISGEMPQIPMSSSLGIPQIIDYWAIGHLGMASSPFLGKRTVLGNFSGNPSLFLIDHVATEPVPGSYAPFT